MSGADLEFPPGILKRVTLRWEMRRRWRNDMLPKGDKKYNEACVKVNNNKKV